MIQHTAFGLVVEYRTINISATSQYSRIVHLLAPENRRRNNCTPRTEEDNLSNAREEAIVVQSSLCYNMTQHQWTLSHTSDQLHSGVHRREAPEMEASSTSSGVEPPTAHTGTLHVSDNYSIMVKTTEALLCWLLSVTSYRSGSLGKGGNTNSAQLPKV